MIDLKDKKILYEFGFNSRISGKELSKKINLSEASTLNRITSLENKNILLGTQAIIDNSKLGYFGYRLYLNFYSTTPADEENMLTWLKNQKEVSVLALCSGSVDVALMSWVKNQNDFEKFFSLFKEKFGSKVNNLDFSLYLQTYHFNRNYLIKDNKKYTSLIVGNSNKENYDELDENILNILSKNARMKLIDISKKLDKPVRTIAFRIKQLENKEIIKGYSLNLNLNNINYEYYKLNISLISNVSFKDLVIFATNLDNSIYIDKTLSAHDFELNVEVKNHKELEEIINKIKMEFNGIKEVKIFQIKKYVKLNYI